MEKDAFKTIGKQLERVIHLELSKLNEEAASNTSKHIKEAARHVAKKFAKESFALHKSLKPKETASAAPSAKNRNTKSNVLKSDQNAGSKKNIKTDAPKIAKTEKVKAVKKSAKPVTPKTRAVAKKKK